MSTLDVPLNLPGEGEVIRRADDVVLRLTVEHVTATFSFTASEAVRLGHALVNAGADAAYMKPKRRPKKGGGK